MHGFIRVAACVPEMRVADPAFNVKAIVAMAEDADERSAAVALFPELALCGYTCADLFQQKRLLDGCASALKEIVEWSKDSDLLIVVGGPLLFKDRLYDCAFVIQDGAVLGAVPKTYLPNYREFYERRWFSSGSDVICETADCGGLEFPFGIGLLFSSSSGLRLGIEICEDLWSVVPPSSWQAIAGANLILNPSASDALVSKAVYRKELVRQQSARCLAAYAYVSSGVHESTTDLVFGGHAILAENGALLSEGRRFERGATMACADFDLQRLSAARVSESSFKDCKLPSGMAFKEIRLGGLNELASLERLYSTTPFVPSALAERNERCEEIFQIQTSGLQKRLEHTRAKKAVIGVSGGLDSTLALLVIEKAMRNLGREPKDVVAVTMPGFGTTGRTLKNAVALIKAAGAELRRIDIRKACLRHFADIGHDPATHSTVYENVQARERTQVLMDIANKEGGIVVGTGDLSEIALGWSTYNGDHISMYAVNCGVPKTLIRYLIAWVAENSPKKLSRTLQDVIDTPVSPELLPRGSDGEINQRTEDIIGPYEIHDFLLYHMVKYGAPPEKLLFLARHAFNGKYSDDILKKTLSTFLSRFFSQQFKRSCIPDGPKVGSICLSPRGDWRMPSDASSELWLSCL